MMRPKAIGVIFSGGRRRLLAGLALIVALGVTIGVVLSTRSPDTNRSARDPGSVSGAATVQRRDLVETDTESGTLSYSNPQTVYNRLSGTITQLPRVGQLIKPGQTLYEIGGEPVILMNGGTPAYRTLASSVSSGADVLQLNRNLVDLGFDSDGITVDDAWQPATTVGVELLQASLGETETGRLSLGQVVFLPGGQRITQVEATLGSTGSGGSSPAANTRTPVVTVGPEFVSLESAKPMPKPRGRRPAGPRGAVSQRTLAALIALLKADTAQLKAETAQLKAERNPSSSGGQTGGGGSGKSRSGSGSSGGGSGSSGGGSGSSGGGSGSSGGGSGSPGGASASSGSGGGGTATAILQTTSTRLIVTVQLDATKQSEAVVGERVTVELPAGDTVNGRITEVSPVAQSSSSSGSGSGSGSGSAGGGGGGGGGSSGASSTIPVTITLSGHHRGTGLDQAAVSVNFAQAKANHVLSVPVTALLATPGGGYALQEAAAPHRLVPVSTGLFAAGYVQISGPGIYPGLQVTDSEG